MIKYQQLNKMLQIIHIFHIIQCLLYTISSYFTTTLYLSLLTFFLFPLLLSYYLFTLIYYSFYLVLIFNDLGPKSISIDTYLLHILLIIFLLLYFSSIFLIIYFTHLLYIPSFFTFVSITIIQITIMSLNNPNKKNDLLAYFCAFTAQTIFPFANLYAIQHNFSISQINIIRSIMVIVLSLFIAHTSNVDLNYALKYSFKQLFVRNVISVGWILALTWSLYYLSLAVIFSINITGSLSIFVWDTYVYNIGINRHQKIGVLLGVIGALLVINANYFLSLIDPNFKMHTDFQYFKSKSISDTVFSASILLIANIAQGYAFSITKSIKIQKSGCQYNLSFGFMMLAFSAIGIMFQTERQPKPWGTYFAVLLLSGVPLTAATQIFSTGLSLSNNTGILALFMTVSVLVSYLIGFYRYHQGFNLFAFVGSVLIIAGISMTIIMKTAPK